MFGDSNIKRNQDILHQEISGITYILTYRFDELKENLFLITGEEDFIIIHVMTNDSKYICFDQSWKSDSKKKDDLIYLAHDFVRLIKMLVAKYPDLKIIISMVLKRFDGKDLLKMYSNGNKIINIEISKHLLEVKNVILIENSDMGEMDFADDKFHLIKSSFRQMCMKWRTEIGK